MNELLVTILVVEVLRKYWEHRAHSFDEIKYSFIVLVEIQSRVDVVQLKVV